MRLTEFGAAKLFSDLAARRAKTEAELHRRLGGRIYRPIVGVKISEDHGQVWKLRSLCDECTASIEPPARAMPCGQSAANCDWCGARNEMYAA